VAGRWQGGRWKGVLGSKILTQSQRQLALFWENRRVDQGIFRKHFFHWGESCQRVRCEAVAALDKAFSAWLCFVSEQVVLACDLIGRTRCSWSCSVAVG
jgi:hypothetical protein